MSQYELPDFNRRIINKQYEMFQFAKQSHHANKLNKILEQKTTWINTAPKDLKDQTTGNRVKARSIYAGKDGQTRPDWEIPVANIDRLQKAQEVLDKGEYASSTEIDSALHDPFYPEFQEPLKYYNDVVTESAAAPMTSQDFPLINNVSIAGQLIIQQQTEFPILSAVNVENTTDLIFRRYYGYGFDIDSVVGELQTTDPKKMSFSRQEWYTRKSGGEIQWSDEHEMQNYIFNPLTLAQGQFSIGANKVKAAKVAKMLADFTTITGASVNAYTGEHNTNNPLTYIATARRTINYTNFGNMNQGALNSATYFAILSNTYIRGIYNTQGMVPLSTETTAAPSVQIPGVPGVSLVLDESLTDGQLYLWDRAKAITRIQGPIRTEQYRMAREGGNGLVYRDWNDVQERDLTKARAITSLIP